MTCPRCQQPAADLLACFDGEPCILTGWIPDGCPTGLELCQACACELLVTHEAARADHPYRILYRRTV